MNASSMDDEREALNRNRQEINRQLQALTAPDGTLDRAGHEMRRHTLLSQIREIERRLADLDVDERSLQCMEGGE
jgi:hypothetical protein